MHEILLIYKKEEEERGEESKVQKAMWRRAESSIVMLRLEQSPEIMDGDMTFVITKEM